MANADDKTGNEISYQKEKNDSRKESRMLTSDSF